MSDVHVRGGEGGRQEVPNHQSPQKVKDSDREDEARAVVLCPERLSVEQAEAELEGFDVQLVQSLAQNGCVGVRRGRGGRGRGFFLPFLVLLLQLLPLSPLLLTFLGLGPLRPRLRARFIKHAHKGGL